MHVFGKLVHIFAWKLVFRTLETSFERFGAIMATGVYSDTESFCKSQGSPRNVYPFRTRKYPGSEGVSQQ